MVDTKDYPKYINLLILIVALYITFLLVKPFLVAILSASIFTYVFYPWHRRISRRIKRKNLSALITTIIVLLLVTVPLVFVLNAVTRETIIFYSVAKQKIVSENIWDVECREGAACSLMNYLRYTVSDPKVKFYLQETLRRLSSYVIDNASSIPPKIASITLNLFIILFSMFFLFRDGEELARKIGELIPMRRAHKKQIIKRFSDVTYAVIYGNIIIALVQGALGAFGFYIFGLKAPLLWGMVMVLVALIPFVGPPIIWVPAGLALILNGYFQGESLIITKGILLLLYGAFVISSIDSFLKPKVIGRRAGVHPLLILFGVLGGLGMFGLIGFVVGPLILAFSVTFLKIYRERIL